MSSHTHGNIVFCAVVESKRIVSMSTAEGYEVSEATYRDQCAKLIEKVDQSKTDYYFDLKDLNADIYVSSGDALIFIVLYEKTYKTGHAKMLLDDVRNKFRTKYPRAGSSDAPLLEKRDFDYEIRLRLKYYNSDEGKSLQGIEENLSQTKDKLLNNLEKIVQRGEALEDMSINASGLKVLTNKFAKDAHELEMKQCWNKWKYWIYGGLLFVIVFIILLLIICKPSFSRCK